MTNAQSKDLETVKWFIPDCMKHILITNDDEIMFLENSERGLHKEKISGMPYTMDGFNALIQGKKWRGIHVHEMYEPGVLESSVPYYSLLQAMPQVVVDFLKKEMFKGQDVDLIDRVYKIIHGEREFLFDYP